MSSFRSSRRWWWNCSVKLSCKTIFKIFCKIVLRNFAKFTGKSLCQGLFFIKVAGLRPTTLLEKRLWHRYFPVNFEKFLRTPFYIEHLWWLLLFFTSLLLVLFIVGIALCTNLKFEERFWISKNVASSFLGYSKLNIQKYIKTYKSIANALNISLVSSAVIFSTNIEYYTSSWSIDSNELFNYIFSHLIRGWLVEASNVTGSSCNR